MWDTQHAVLFSQSLCMNASELKITLPWDPILWEAQNATEFINALSVTPPAPYYLSVLKAYTNPRSASAPTHLNALSRVLILHGLMSISWDLSRRDQTSLGLSLTRNLPWQTRISACYDAWKADFDNYTTSVLSSLSFSPNLHAKFQRFTVANLAVCHTAQLILSADIIDLQINAGARHIIGRPVTASDKERSRIRINEWICENGGERASKATWHAARLFRDGVRKLENWNVDEMFHYPWCLYLATLTCWTLQHASAKAAMAKLFVHPDSRDNVRRMSEREKGNSFMQHERLGGDGEGEEDDWDSKAEMNALISAMTRLEAGRGGFAQDMWRAAGKGKIGGLLGCMVKQLGTVRWAVVREGMIVLRGLLEGPF
jgi:hypothetical protein